MISPLALGLASDLTEGVQLGACEQEDTSSHETHHPQ